MIQRPQEYYDFILDLDALYLKSIKVSEIKQIADAVWNSADEEILVKVKLFKSILLRNPHHTFESFKELVSYLS
jgi:hypothetical protein